MCLGIPMKIKQLNQFSVVCEARGIEREASLLMMLDQPLAEGDFVMISMGNVIARIEPEEAEQAWTLYDELFDSIDSA